MRTNLDRSIQHTLFVEDAQKGKGFRSFAHAGMHEEQSPRVPRKRQFARCLFQQPESCAAQNPLPQLGFLQVHQRDSP
jgi:hypothetical protein